MEHEITCSGILHCICTGNIAFHGYECMVGKSTLHLVFDWVGLVNGTTSNRVTRLHEMENMCRVLVKRDRSPLG